MCGQAGRLIYQAVKDMGHDLGRVVGAAHGMAMSERCPDNATLPTLTLPTLLTLPSRPTRPTRRTLPRYARYVRSKQCDDIPWWDVLSGSCTNISKQKLSRSDVLPVAARGVYVLSV